MILFDFQFNVLRFIPTKEEIIFLKLNEVFLFDNLKKEVEGTKTLCQIFAELKKENESRTQREGIQ